MANFIQMPDQADADERLLRQIDEEQKHAGSFTIPVHLDLISALSVVGNLQLALRHPMNTGPSVAIVRQVIDGLIERMEQSGYFAHAEAARRGDDPAQDFERTVV